MNPRVQIFPYLRTGTPTRWAAPRRVGFTLVELLVVMSIIVLLAVAILPAARGPLDTINLAGSIENVAAQLSLARQTAMSRNTSVDLRIYNTGTATSPVWNTIALVIPSFVSSRAADEFIGPPTTLSGNVVIDPSKTFFTLSDNTNVAPTTSTSATVAPWTGTEGVLSSLKNKTYIGFRFLADGSTNLPDQHTTSDPAWCLSVRNANAQANGTLPAKNFATFVIDTATGRPLVFRP